MKSNKKYVHFACTPLGSQKSWSSWELTIHPVLTKGLCLSQNTWFLIPSHLLLYWHRCLVRVTKFIHLNLYLLFSTSWWLMNNPNLTTISYKRPSSLTLQTQDSESGSLACGLQDVNFSASGGRLQCIELVEVDAGSYAGLWWATLGSQLLFTTLELWRSTFQF